MGQVIHLRHFLDLHLHHFLDLFHLNLLHHFFDLLNLLDLLRAVLEGRSKGEPAYRLKLKYEQDFYVDETQVLQWDFLGCRSGFCPGGLYRGDGRDRHGDDDCLKTRLLAHP